MEAYKLRKFSIYMLGIDILHKVLKNNNFHENLSGEQYFFFCLFGDFEGDILKSSCNKCRNLFSCLPLCVKILSAKFYGCMTIYAIVVPKYLHLQNFSRKITQ